METGKRDLVNMEGIFELTSLCPYTEICESYRTISRSERWMEQALSRMRREGLDKLPKSEGGYTIYLLEERLNHMKRVKDRCYRYNKRCLRFWQLERIHESRAASDRMRNRLTILGGMRVPVISESQV